MPEDVRRSDGWLRRSEEALRELEATAYEDLVEYWEEVRRRHTAAFQATRTLGGVDLARGPDRTVWACSCGWSGETLDDLATHAVRGHRWPPEDLLDLEADQ